VGGDMNLKLKMRILETFESQADFSQATGIGESRLSRIIRCRVEPTRDEKVVIAKELREKANELFSQVRK